MTDAKTETNFVHLHVHSDYSLMESCATINKLISKASELGMKSLAITDTGNMSGVPVFYDCCNQKGIKPIVGQEFKIIDKIARETSKLFKLVLLCQNETGYKNLCKLSSASYDKVSSVIRPPYITWEELQKYHEGLICLSGGAEGEISCLLLEEKRDEAILRAKEYNELFGENCFYLELQNHGYKNEWLAMQKMYFLSKELDLKLVATNDIHYISKEDAKAQEVLSCINQKTSIKEPHKRLGDNFRVPEDEDSSEWYFKSQEEMADLFYDFPEAIENTGKIAEMCNLTIHKYPLAGIMDNLPQIREFEDKSSADNFLRKQVFSGLEERYGVVTKEIQERADYELGIITGRNFTNYFLILWELVKWAKPRMGIGPGRGAAAASIVNYALGITGIDPLQHGLHFERFINPERVSFPDIDLDVEHRCRNEIIEHLRKEYGNNCVSNIITFGTLNAVKVLSEVGRVLEIPLSEINELKNCIPNRPYAKLYDAFTESDWVEDKGKLIPYKDDPRYIELFDIAKRLESVKRNIDVHASAVVISKDEISNYVPTLKDSQCLQICTQYTRNELYDNGLMEYDFLGWDAISKIRYIEDFVNRKKKPGEELFSASKITNDQKTYELFSAGNTDDIPFFESDSMKEYLRELRPDRIEDLAALDSLYRPGPMKFIPMFINGKRNPEKIKCFDGSLRPVLEKTYGVIVFQEQVMTILQIIAGYTLAEADLIRRELGKRKVETIQKHKKDFIERALKNGFEKDLADNIFDELDHNTSYSFCKAHAISYATIAYQVAYLKVHYPVEFKASLEALKAEG